MALSVPFQDPAKAHNPEPLGPSVVRPLRLDRAGARRRLCSGQRRNPMRPPARGRSCGGGGGGKVIQRQDEPPI